MPWTMNDNGEPFCWIHESWAAYDRKHDPGKDERLAAAHELMAWFGEVMAYLDHEQWTFAVDKKGKYLPGTTAGIKPESFTSRIGQATLTIAALDPSERVPHRREELTHARDKTHEFVSMVLMQLLGQTQANKWLAELRAACGLSKIRKSDVWGSRPLLF